MCHNHRKIKHLPWHPFFWTKTAWKTNTGLALVRHVLFLSRLIPFLGLVSALIVIFLGILPIIELSVLLGLSKLFFLGLLFFFLNQLDDILDMVFSNLLDNARAEVLIGNLRIGLLILALFELLDMLVNAHLLSHDALDVDSLWVVCIL